MPNVRSGLRRFAAELQRRKVLRVLFAYLVVAWLVIVVVSTTWEALFLPPGTLTVVILMAVAGLPLVAVLAWTYDLVPDAGSSTGTGADPRDGASLLADLAAAAGVPPPLRPRPAQHRQGVRPETPRLPDTLPSPGTPFIGRAAELEEIASLLRDAGCRLVTVTGPGGVGKTRLALQAAQQLGPGFAHGVAYLSLSGLSSPDLLASALAEVFGITISRRDDPLKELTDYLREKELLLVLDTFEHLTDGAALIAAILERAPRVRALVTSRERLNIQPETLLDLAGLPVVDDDHGDAEALGLFAAAAGRVGRPFRMDGEARACAVRICTLLDGMPLGIELAAAWVRVLSCAEIADELERGVDMLSSTAADLPQRHRSLRATFDASWGLLSEAERRALVRLAVFRSSFDRHAARAVAGADAALLRALLDKSLLSRAGGRFLMLDVVRQYAAQRLDPEAAAAARAAHVAYFTTLLGRLRRRLMRSDPDALTQVAEVIDEVRSAWSHAVERADAVALGTALDGLFDFYEARGWASEGRNSFARAAEAIGNGASAPDRVVALTRARLDVRHGAFCDRLGQHAEAESLLRRGLAAALEVGQKSEISFALQKLATNRCAMGEYEEARHALGEALALAESLNDPRATAWSLTHLGSVAWAKGDYERATQLYRDALTIHREQEDRSGLWTALNNLGVIAGAREDFPEARRRFRAALEVQTELGNQRSTAMLLHNLGNISLLAGDLADAREQLEAARAIAEEMGYRAMLAHTLAVLADVALRENDLPAAEAMLGRALGSASAARNHPVTLQALLTLARVRLAQGDAAAAADLAAAVAAHPASERQEMDDAKRLLTELGVSGDTATATLAGAGRGADFERWVGEVLAQSTSPDA
jgi:predicted ATPase